MDKTKHGQRTNEFSATLSHVCVFVFVCVCWLFVLVDWFFFVLVACGAGWLFRAPFFSFGHGVSAELGERCCLLRIETMHDKT